VLISPNRTVYAALARLRHTRAEGPGAALLGGGVGWRVEATAMTIATWTGMLGERDGWRCPKSTSTSVADDLAPLPKDTHRPRSQPS
jgi:hypothetical protein